MTSVLDQASVVAPTPAGANRGVRRPLMAVVAVGLLLVFWELVKVLVPENGVSIA